MKIEEKQLNLIWSEKAFIISEKCMAMRYRDIEGILPDRYEVSDGKSNYSVSEEVFDLFMEAYFRGKEDGERKAAL